MKTVDIGGVRFGEGRTKLIVPLTESKREDIDKTVPSLLESKADMIEWRIDLFCGSDDTETVLDELSHIKEILNKSSNAIPLLATYRSKAEGGEGNLSGEGYMNLLEAVMESQKADAIDIELCHGDDIVSHLVNKAASMQTVSIISSHDFEKTPPASEITSRLLKMKDLGCDIAKMAVMPKKSKDVTELMEATRGLSQREDMPPMITMSMGQLGVASRIVGSRFGSCASFASHGNSSAPGQVEIGVLSYVLCLE